MRKQLLVLLFVLPMAVILCLDNALAQDPVPDAEESPAPAYEKRVLFEPLQVPSVGPRDDGPTLFVPALFRPPVPWLKIDDRYESFMDNVEIQAELQQMEKLFLNPYESLGRDLTAGIKTEIGTYGEEVRYYEFAGGKFEFSTSSGGFGRPGGWGNGYNYDSWLGNSNRIDGDR